jgi:hypothetical protein
MEDIIQNWTDRAKYYRLQATKTQNELLQQGYYVEAQVLEVCIEEVTRALPVQQATVGNGPDVEKILEDFDSAIDTLIRTMRSAFNIPPKGG